MTDTTLPSPTSTT